MFVWESDGKQLFAKSNFTQFVNQDVKMSGRRLYSPSLKDVTWLEDDQLIFLIFHTFVCNLFPANRVYPASSSPATSFKLGEYNLLPSILTLRFTNCVELHFGKKIFCHRIPIQTLLFLTALPDPSRWRSLFNINPCWAKQL